MPYCQVNGFAAHYIESGKGETLVLLHAGGTSSAHWRKVVPLLQDRFRIIAPDLIGFGETGAWGGGRELTHDDQADLVRGILQFADAGSVHLVGHSYGGAVAVRLALRCWCRWIRHSRALILYHLNIVEFFQLCHLK
jgi:pimeloyl-ACP methyl ester carboxylesterase